MSRQTIKKIVLVCFAVVALLAVGVAAGANPVARAVGVGDRRTGPQRDDLDHRAGRQSVMTLGRPSPCISHIAR